MKIRDALETSAMLITMACAIIAVVYILRTPSVNAGPSRGRLLAADSVKDWTKYARQGHRLGVATAAVTIIEFGDFECPVCARFANGPLRAIRTAYPNDVQVIFRHWPLTYHRFAYPAARAAECADHQGRFEQFSSKVYEKQDSLGLLTFDQYAVASGVPDIAAFHTCNSSSGPIPSIEDDIKAALELGAKGTPTVIVQGLMLSAAPDSVGLDSLVRKALAQRVGI